MLGHQCVSFDVEEKVRWRALRPQFGVALRRQCIIGRVDLDGVEALGVKAQAILGGADRGWVKQVRFDQRGIGPGGGAHTKFNRTLHP
jgi:hypothetical protein